MSSYSQQPSCQSVDHTIMNENVVQGRILFLPPFHDTPDNSVERALGKKPVDRGIFNHPVVICSRPTENEQTGEEGNFVHFHVITSFGRKKLAEIYNRPNKFHKEQRSHYLPISPTPVHPDATTKAEVKKLPSLKLQGRARLQWDSYVDVHKVYKIKWFHLRSYRNVDTPWNLSYRLDEESLKRMLGRSKRLTKYVPGPQFEPGSARLPISNPAISSTDNSQPAKSTSPLLAEVSDAESYGSIQHCHNEQTDAEENCLGDCFLAVGSTLTALADCAWTALECVGLVSRGKNT